MLSSPKNILHYRADELNELANHVGHTPVTTIHMRINNISHCVHLKLEAHNPTGSMKDRTGYALIQHVKDQAQLQQEPVIIESTSGNLGVALAFQCKVRGYHLLAIIDPKTTPENIAKMEALGARIEMVRQADPTGGYLLSRLARVQQLCDQQSNYIWTDQYSSSANPYIHYTQTGPEIYAQMMQQVGAIFVPVSTGGTLAGIGRFFRKTSPTTQVIGVDAYGSVIFGTPAAPRKLTGIGSSKESDFIRKHLYDDYILVKDEEAFAFCHSLYAATGIKIGGSSGATLAACARYLALHPYTQNVVCICADGGENYATTIYSEEWLNLQGIKLDQQHLGPVEAITL